MNGIIVKNNVIVKSTFRNSQNKTGSKNSQLSIKRKSRFSNKFDLGKNKRSSLTSVRPTIKFFNFNDSNKNNNKKKSFNKPKINGKKSVKKTKKINLDNSYQIGNESKLKKEFIKK